MIPGSRISLERRTRFRHDEDGALTAYGLMLFAAMAMISAVALDVSYLLASRTHLQVAADSAAHAALYLREETSEIAAKAGAVDLIEAQFPPEIYGTVIAPGNITYGSWDYASRTFSTATKTGCSWDDCDDDDDDKLYANAYTIDSVELAGYAPTSASRNAVHVVVGQTNAQRNPIETFLFKLVGLDSFDVTAQAVYALYRPTCLTEGFVAQGGLDIQSNNTFTSGFCLHSNTSISLNNNNVFEAGAIVSIPDLNDVDVPSAGWDASTGLSSALRYGSYQMRLVNRIDDLVLGLKSRDTAVLPDYVTDTMLINIADTQLDATHFTRGRVHWAGCGTSGGNITIAAGTLLQEVVLVTNCDVFLGEGVRLEDVIIATESTTTTSITGPSGVHVGRADNCAAGGGAQLITLGSMKFAAELHLSNGQLIAEGDISFSASANGVRGASIIAGGTVSGTSNMEMSFCGTGMEDNFAEEYFRLVQ